MNLTSMTTAPGLLALLSLLTLTAPRPAFAADLPVESVTASADDGNVPANVLDGDLGTRWSCLGRGCWIRLKLQRESSVSSVSLAFYQGDRRANSFDISLSTDGQSYTRVFRGTSALTTQPRSYGFTARSARYVKVTVNGNTINDWASITEARVEGTPPQDAFGINQLYPSAAAPLAWDSSHWNDGVARTLSGRDPRDPTGISQARGNGTLRVDGQGILTMNGSQPRLYLNDPGSRFWLNTEVTVYYRRVTDSDANYAGVVVGVRSGPDGHSSSGNYCDAHTYYGRLRNDGKMDFAKEIEHPNSTAKASKPVFSTPDIPRNEWIGVKYVTYNLSQSRIKLELYMDRTQGANGGTWVKLGEYTDEGGWTSPQSCGYPDDLRILEPGVVLIRNTDVEEAHYKWVSVREISVP